MKETRSSTQHYFSSVPDSKEKYGLIRTFLRDLPFEFVTASSVFSKKRLDTGTRLLIESMLLPKNGAVLDVGCGYGPVGIACARFNPELRVIMTDVNTRAVHLSRENIARNKVPNAEARLGRLYEPVEGLRFDIILSNPPISAGLDTVQRLIEGAANFLQPMGTLQVVVRSQISGKKLLSFFQSAFGNFRVLDRKSGYRVLIAEKQISAA